MNKLTLTAGIVIGVVAGAGRIDRAQQQSAVRPDFSGKWAVDTQASSPGLLTEEEPARAILMPSATTSPTTLVPSFANAFVARQNSETLRVQRDIRQGTTMILNVVYYRLDGSETTNIEGGFTKTASRATWQDGRLTILTHIADADTLPRLNLERVMSLDANGRLLIDTENGIDPTYLTVYRRAN
jgi:hypothetical protein